MMSFRGCFLVLLALTIPGCHRSNPAQQPGTPLDVSRLTRQPGLFHDKVVHVQGIVTSVCEEEGCFIDVVPLSGKGDGVLVSARHGAFKFPRDSVGKIAVVKGTFYTKVYPFSRMNHWHHHGWRAWEKKIPPFARIFRIEADSVRFKEPEKDVTIEEAPLVPFSSPVIDLDQEEFEAARMGTGKKCLNPKESTPEHSTRRYHELLFAIEGELTVRMQNRPDELKLSPNQACYIPPHTKHSLTNKGGRRACYIFVYSLPEKSEEPTTGSKRPGTPKHAH